MIGIKGAGEMASGVAWRLYQAGFGRIFMMEIPAPLAVRREVSFCEAVHDARHAVEGVTAAAVADPGRVPEVWEKGEIAVVVDPRWEAVGRLAPQVVVDAILAKRNLGTRMDEAPLVVALGPGFTAGVDAHMVIETNRGHHLGRVITSGAAEPNTGVPGPIGGHTERRVLRAPADGLFVAESAIGELVAAGEVVGRVGEAAVKAGVGGVLRGLIRDRRQVKKGLKIGDIDPRGEVAYCYTISDKARAIGGAVLEAVLRRFNR